MLKPDKICRIIAILNVLVVLFIYIQTPNNSSNQNFKEPKEFFTKDSFQTKQDTNENDIKPTSGSLSKEELQEKNIQLQKEIQNLLDRKAAVDQILRGNNPFRALGAYKEYTTEYGKIYFDEPNYGLSHDDNYCETVDLYNLANPKNIFEEKNFFTDHSNLSLVRNVVMKELGEVFTKEIYKRMKPKPGSKKVYLDYKINNFFTNHPNFHWYHQIGHNFLCATQMYNHIPGHTAFVHKGEIIKHLNNYIEHYKDRPQCFERESLFPVSYRLSDKKECETFFEIINSRAYQKSLQTEPLQYLIKVTAGVHKAEGVHLLDEEMTKTLKSEYDNGKACGTVTKHWLAQRYISNPLLLAHHNKFDFRIYMLIASTNPLIVYYHDGFPRVSLHTYNTSSSDKAAHLTNSALSSKVIQEALEKNLTVNDMSAEEINKYKTWNVEDLVDYLLEIGMIKDPKWLDNYLRPAFKKALVHLIRMTGRAFWSQSNVYELNGVDFMLDDNLKLWFIESNPNPYLNSQTRGEFFPKMLFDLFEIQYAYYRSRMLRVLDVVRSLQKAEDSNEAIDYSEWKERYQGAAKNRLEPEFNKINRNNGFKLIMDENREGHKAYFGHIQEECL